MRSILAILFLALLTTTTFAQTKASLVLNWVPEPEFGGIYEAKRTGAFQKNGLDIDIKPGGAGAPTWQRVARGQAEFGVSSADEVVIARANGADVVAIFTIYQTCPQGIMVHESRGLTKIDEVFKSGTLAMEVGLPYGKFLKKKYGFDGVKTIPYAGGIANFLADKNFAQQCFVFSEPIAAKKQGATPKVFLIADAGYNPYTGVIIVNGAYLKSHAKEIDAMVKSLQAGWESYLKDPKPANDEMGQLNKNMDADTFAAAAEAQKPMVEDATTKEKGLGVMTKERWAELTDQLSDLKIVAKKVNPDDCFRWTK